MHKLFNRDEGRFFGRSPFRADVMQTSRRGGHYPIKKQAGGTGQLTYFTYNYEVASLHKVNTAHSTYYGSMNPYLDFISGLIRMQTALLRLKQILSKHVEQPIQRSCVLGARDMSASVPMIK